MSFKRIIVLVMTLVMIVSACAPTLNVFAANSHDHDHQTETKKEIDYVSLGDSVASGLGLAGYDSNGFNLGLPSVAPESFPAKFAAWLAGSDVDYTVSGMNHVFNGDKGQVNLVQLAMNSVRVEDALYLLMQDSDALSSMTPAELEEANAWLCDKVIGNNAPAGVTAPFWAAFLSGTYQNAVKNADIISLGFGNADLTEYLVAVVKDLVEDGHKYDYMTLENAVDLFVDVDNIELDATVIELYNKCLEVLSDSGCGIAIQEDLAGRIAYVAASYLVSYDKLIELIVEINPEAEIVIVPSVMAVEGLEFIVEPLNATVAAGLTVRKGLQEYESTKFYYADVEDEIEFVEIEGVKAPDADSHTVIANAVIDAYNNGYEVQDETIENIIETVKLIAGLVVEYYDDAYALGYQYADDKGYIDLSMNAIDEAIEAIKLAIVEVDAGLLGVTSELEGKLIEELNATIETLEELYDVLDSGSASDVDGLVAAIFALEDDLYTHLANIYAILEQAAIDVNQLVLAPAFKEALRVLTEEVLPKIDAALKEIVDNAVDYVVAKLQPYYDKALEIYGITLDVYNRIVALAVRINTFVEDNMDEFIEIYGNVVDILVKVYGNVEKAVNAALDIYEFVVAHKEEIKLGLNIAHKVYDGIVDIIKAVYGERETIEFVAGKIYVVVAKLIEILDIEEIEYVIDFVGDIINNSKDVIEVIEKIARFIIDNREAIAQGIINAKQVYDYIAGVVGYVIDNDVFNKAYNQIVDLITEIYTTTNDVHTTAIRLCEYIIAVGVELNAEFEEMLYNAVNGSYELTLDSAYVALGNSPFGEELATKLNLLEKYYQSDLRDGEYLDKVADADLITIKVDNGEFREFVNQQVAGTVAVVLKNNQRLLELYEHPILGGYVSNVLDSFNIDLEAEREELDWNKYLNADDQKKLESALALLKAELISRGIPEYYYIDLNPIIDEVLEENGLAGLPGITVNMELIEVPVADLVVYAVENALYSYARYTHDLDALLTSIYAASPNATVVLLGVDNPLDGLSFDLGALNIDCVDYESCIEISEVVREVFNAQLYLTALKNDNTIFVLENDADAIYDALHVYCRHNYDDCVDTVCNICGEERVAPGHSFTNYIDNNDATCTKKGTETAKCDNCDATHTRDTKMKDHDYTKATCTKPATCRVCGQTKGSTASHTWESATCTDPKTCTVCHKTQGSALGHKFGSWNVIEEATRKNDGCEKRECSRCGLVETRIIPMILPKYTVGTIIAVIMSAIATAAGISALILWRLRKKDILK